MMSLFSNIFRRLRRQKIVRRLTAHDLMEKALKISANNVIIYDIRIESVHLQHIFMLHDFLGDPGP